MEWSKQEDAAMDMLTLVGDTAYVETVSRTVTYTFAPTSLSGSGTLTYYNESAAGTANLDSAGWYFSGTITGTVSEYINGTQNASYSGDSKTYAAENVLVEVSLSYGGTEVFVGDDSVNSGSYSATITLTGATVDSYENEVVAEWSASMTASATGSEGTKVEELTYSSIRMSS